MLRLGSLLNGLAGKWAFSTYTWLCRVALIDLFCGDRMTRWRKANELVYVERRWRSQLTGSEMTVSTRWPLTLKIAVVRDEPIYVAPCDGSAILHEASILSFLAHVLLLHQCKRTIAASGFLYWRRSATSRRSAERAPRC